jgi:hypothetical protein
VLHFNLESALNIQKLDINTIIILDGEGYKKGAEIWLKDQVSA